MLPVLRFVLPRSVRPGSFVPASASVVAAAAAVLAAAAPLAAQDVEVSRPGVYEGYAEATYDGRERSSFYVTVRDGTRLAVDLYRPTRDGELHTEPLPVVWMHTPYNRRTYRGQPTVEAYPGYAARLIPYGYIVAVVDFRGLYASFGTNRAFNRGEWVEPARTDAYDVTEWLADQPWSNGRIGMWGCSATGGSQMQAATTRPPSLRAIFPMSCEFDAYSFAVRGGVAYPSGENATPPDGEGSVARRDRSAVPVDGPEGPDLLAEAVDEHRDNVESAGYVPFRDSPSENLGGVRWWLRSSPHTFLDALEESEIGVYAAANWDEAGTKYGAPFTYRNLEDRAKLILGPATHCDWTTVREDTGFDIVVEELRFFDYWLKGVENGVMEEPGVTYYTYHAPEGDGWRTASTWPLPNEVRTDFHLREADASGEGGLERSPPDSRGTTSTALDDAPEVTSTAVEGGGDGATFVTEPLEQDLEVTGHPVVALRISSTAEDVDVFAVLEDVAPDGTATTHNMVGQLRASHRDLADAPYDEMGLPWHTHREDDARPLVPGEPAELVFDLLPISYVFREGHRIRLRLTFADTRGEAADDHTVTVLHGPDRGSTLTLPVIPRE